jgi:uncharacterized protein (TIGR03790 family)
LVAAEAAPRVLILANRDNGESLAVARHYAERRGLPESSIVALPMPLTEQITWPEFVTSIWNPLLREAISRGDIDAMAMSLKDGLGRTKIVSSGHRLDALVICRGVPLRVAHDETLFDEKSSPLAVNASLRSVEGSVDSELALLAVNCPTISAFVPNPVLAANSGAALERALREIIPVGRLDGPSVEDAKGLVDLALKAERDGLAGRAYVDIGGKHAQGDEWLEACVGELAALGFETDVDRAKTTLSAASRFDAPVLYFGWYEADLNGPFAAPGFRFPPGAIALHIHSYSAQTLRSPARGWSGPLVARGVTATFGNVGEPYLQFTHQPHLFLRAIADGSPLGVAALRSINALSWKAIILGDPLYRPFAVSAEAQWTRRSALTPDAEAYACIRRMGLLASAGKLDEALSTGYDGMVKNPNLALILSLSGMQLKAGDATASRRTLGVASTMRTWRAADRPLILSAARALHAAGASGEAAKLIDRLLDEQGLSRDIRVEILKSGVELARSAKDFTRAGRWDAEYQRLVAPAAASTGPSSGKGKPTGAK